MKMPKTSYARNELIAALREAVMAQIEFWDLALATADLIEVDSSLLIEFCQGAAICADNGKELGETDLQDLLRWLATRVDTEVRPGPFRIK
jgi:hypothetical protein